MKKMPTLFERDETAKGRPVIDRVRPGCEWVLAGEGVPTRKLDGTNVEILSGELYKRQKPASGDYDEASYVLARRDDPADKYLFQAFDREHVWLDGVYECVGPKIQGDPEKELLHTLVRVSPVESRLILDNLAIGHRTFEGLRCWLGAMDVEGVVFHRNSLDPDCDKAKIKGRDFGIKRG